MEQKHGDETWRVKSGHDEDFRVSGRVPVLRAGGWGGGVGAADYREFILKAPDFILKRRRLVRLDGPLWKTLEDGFAGSHP